VPEFPDGIRKNLLFSLNYALRFKTSIKWRKQPATSETAAEELVTYLEGSNYVVMNGPVNKRGHGTPGPTFETSEQAETRMARHHVNQLYLQRVQQDVEDGLEPEAARNYGHKLIADLRRDELFRDLRESIFKNELMNFGGMVLQLSHYKGKLQPTQSHALENIWEALYAYTPKEL
jgi:hypothetical protein